MRCEIAIGVLAVALASGPAGAQSNPPAPITQAAAAPQPAAKPGAEDNRRDYPAAYFAQYAPTSALQIVQRVPGFVIEDTDQNVRGFGQAAGNVVINGQRPSSKTDGLSTILSRIPANRVLRVELAPGERYGADYSAKAQVVNLVLIADAGVSGTIEGSVRREFTGKLHPAGGVSALIKRGKSTFNLAATIENEPTSEEGYDEYYGLNPTTLIERRDKVNRINDPYGALSASWEHNGGTNRTAHLNGRFAVDRFRLDQVAAITRPGGFRRDDTLYQYSSREDYELGGDITRPFLGGGMKFIALATRRDRRNRDGLRQGGGNGFTQALDDVLDERLGRIVWSRPGLGPWTVDAGGEVVFNRLRSRVDLFNVTPAGRTRIDLPVDDATVSERRGEAFVNAGRALAKALRLDAGLTYENSYLTVRGDASAERRLSFWKPSLTLDWRPSKWRGQLSVKRTVAQLQFTDFISSAELTTDRVNGGNPDLVPQRAWEGLLTIERPLLGDGLAKLELGYNRISQVQDRVPTPDGFDAPGNLGSGEVWVVRPRLDVPLKDIGVKGGRLTLFVSYVKTRVQDPYTLRDRRFSGNGTLYAEATFRQDRGSFAWGLTGRANTHSTVYRLNETDGLYRRPFVQVFGEYRPDKATTMTLTIDNLLNSSATRERFFYTPTRRTPDPFQFEQRHRNQHLVPTLTVKRTFG